MARPLTASRGRRTLAGVAAAATALGGLGLLAPTSSSASSHREAPFIAGEPRVDNTDVYAFTSPDDEDSVTLIGNWIPFQEPNGGPNFYPWADGVNYDINIDNDGDAVADLTYRWVFSSGYRNVDTFLYNTGVVTTLDDPDLNFQQTYDLTVIREGAPTITLLDNAPVAPSNVGPASMPNYQALRDEAITPVTTLAGAGSSFAGQADDSFFLDLRIFDLLYGGDLSEVGNDTLNGYNVNTIALQVPKAAVAQNNLADRNPVIGVWSDTEMPSTRVLSDSGTVTTSGPSVQVSRLGNPLVNEVVIPISDKDEFNASTPVNDGQFLDFVTDPEVPKLIEAIYGIPAPATPRNDLVSVFLTGIDGVNSLAVNQDVASIAPGEMLRLNMSTPVTENPDRLGVIGGDSQGFPNGRRLADDVVDIALQVLEGELVGSPNDLGDAVDSNDLPFGANFPYVALPHNSSVNQTQFAGFDRLAGTDRFGTAAVIAIETFGTSDTVLLANGRENHLADALAGNYLAGFKDAPILLTDDGGIPAVTQAALDTLGTTRVIILGGTDAVSAEQETSLRARYEVERVGGTDRYETAKLIALEPGPGNVGSATALVARGDVFPDALVSGPLAFRSQFPILLVRPDSAGAPTTTALDELGIRRVIIVGGTAAVSASVEDELLRSLGADAVGVTRLAGTNRQETAVAVAKFATGTAVAVANFATGELGFSRLHVNLARGDMAADALSGGPHAGREGSVILLAQTNEMLGDATQAYLAAESISLEGGHIFGGTEAISAAVVAAATDAANGNDPTLE